MTHAQTGKRPSVTVDYYSDAEPVTIPEEWVRGERPSPFVIAAVHDEVCRRRPHTSALSLCICYRAAQAVLNAQQHLEAEREARREQAGTDDPRLDPRRHNFFPDKYADHCWHCGRRREQHIARDGECPECVPHPAHTPGACRVCGPCPGKSITPEKGS